MEGANRNREAWAALLGRVLASRTFARSPRLARFLEVICTLALDGRDREISEQQIGVAVFGRSPMYNASEDSIVRTQARLLRQRLEEYFEQEDSHSEWIVTIPRGGYVPVFEARPAKEPAPAPAAVPALSAGAPAISAASPRLPFVTAVVLSLLLGLALGAMAHHIQRRETDPFWAPIFGSGRPVLIVNSDDALVLLQEASRTPVSLNDYRSGSWMAPQRLPELAGAQIGPKWFASHQYTSSADLNLALRLGRLPTAAQAQVESRNARDVRLDDLKENNVILIGGSGANPWVSLFDDRLNFSVRWDWQNARGFVQNKHPAAGELAAYQEDPSVSAPKSYGVLAYLPGVDGNGKVLLFEGTGMAGTESAADFPFSGELFDRFKHTLGAGGGTMPYFEVLLETSSLGGNAPAPQVVAFRRIDTPTPP